MKDDTLRILIGDAQSRVRFGLRVLLEEQAGWRVVAEAADTAALLKLVRDGCPDVVLVDWELPGLPAEQILAALRRACPTVRVVLMSSNDDLRERARQSGADLFVYKADPPDRLLQLIRGLTANPVAP
jgi:DNA-binding NarL/FixJ family response regulator